MSQQVRQHPLAPTTALKSQEDRAMTTASLPETTNPLQHIERDRFTVACRQAAEVMHKPEYNGRLEKGHGPGTQWQCYPA